MRLNLKYLLRISAAIVCGVFFCTETYAAGPAGKGVVVAYTTSWTDDMPDPEYFDCLNYAFARINDTYDGVEIDNVERFRQIIDMCRARNGKQVLLSVGGWGRGGFSEMAADAKKRRAFAWNCRKLIWDMGFDGIDIDWEYPTQSDAGIAASEDDINNFTLLLKELRTAIGPKRVISVAVISTGMYFDFRESDQYVDYYNVMCYDMGQPPFHNAPLYKSNLVQNISVSDATYKLIAAGAPRNKIVIGIPFYGRGNEDFPEDTRSSDARLKGGYFYNWDEDAKAPYLTDKAGKLCYSYDDTVSIRYKCEFIRQMNLKGAMCWPTSGDDENGTLLKSVREHLSVSR